MRADFDSLYDFAVACDGLKPKHDDDFAKEWTGETYAESLAFCKTGGNAALVAESEKLIDKIDAQLPETAHRHWQQSVIGAFPCVPAYLAGEPESMWSLADDVSPHAPIRVYVCTTSSAAVKKEDFMRRGTAILAFTLMAARSRPVELYTYTAIGNPGTDMFVVAKLPSHPMMLSEVCYALTSAGFARILAYGYAMHHWGYRDGWGDSTISDGHRAGPHVRKALGMEPDDVHIGPIHYEDQCLTDPVGFVNSELSKIGLLAE